MIHDLDKTIKKLLEKELADSLNGESIYFDTPDEKFAPNIPAINLFLYDVRENRELRSNEWTVERQSGGTAYKRPSPVRVDCSYLITAWASDAEGEHRLLGEVMKVLLRHPLIEKEFCHENLKEQDHMLPSTTLQPGRLQSMGEFWQALGGKPKATLNFTVTMGIEPFKPFETGPLVTEKVIRIRQHSGQE